jgi:A/G-specific adenine glycosylase
MATNNKSIANLLTTWFNLNARDLPWRRNRTAYSTWVSEVMLQQTQVIQVIPYFQKFMHKFPEITFLANASLQEVLKIWEGMGYYARARNMHRAAQLILQNHQGQIPQDMNELRKLPGFGPYISSAILSLAFGQAYSVMDGNVIRVISRLTGIHDNVRLASTQAHIRHQTDSLLDKEMPGMFNEAIMELGAIICLPVNPKCGICPLQSSCEAAKQKITHLIPNKPAVAKRPKLTVDMFILVLAKKYLLVKRPENGLLGGLWEFPAYLAARQRKQQKPAWINLEHQLLGAAKPVRSLAPIKHTYSHFQVIINPHVYQTIEPDFASDFYGEHTWVNSSDFVLYPMHRAAQKVKETFLEVITK